MVLSASRAFRLEQHGGQRALALVLFRQAQSLSHGASVLRVGKVLVQDARSIRLPVSSLPEQAPSQLCRCVGTQVMQDCGIYDATCIHPSHSGPLT